MPKRKTEVPFLLNKGIETKAPELTSTAMLLTELDNFHPVFERLRALRAHASYVTMPNEEVRALAYSFDLAERTLNFYAITDGKVFKLELVGEVAGMVEIGTFTWSTQQIITWAAWDDSLASEVYFTKWDTFLTKITAGTVAEIAATWDGGAGLLKLSARYCAVIDNRLFIANIKVSDGRHFTHRVQWSDLYNPDDFEIIRGKEGDLFDLETGTLEITGIFTHRGYLTVFSRRSIWRAIYIGYPKVYRFEPVYSDFGSVHHGAAISTKELIFFIGDDNFYVLDGFSPRAIGNDIWNWWLENSVNTTEDEILALSDPFNNEVMWKFRRKALPVAGIDYRSADHDWLLVYNYKENRWSTRTADGINCMYSNRYPLRGFQSWDSFHSGWDENGELTSTVGFDDYPWRQLIFTAQDRLTDVVTVTSVGHGLTSGNMINVIDSTPSDMNGTLLVVTVTGVDTFTYEAAGDDEAASELGTSDFRSFDGDWQYFNFPQQALVGRSGEVASYQNGEFIDFLGLQIVSKVVSQELFFGTFMDSKELTEAKLVYKKVGDPDIKLFIGIRDNQNEPIEWSDAFVERVITADSEARFILAKGLRSKFFSIRLEITNTPTDYVTEINGGALYLSGLQTPGSEV